MTPLRIAIIGAGAFGRRHITTVSHEPTCTLAALADPAPAVASVAAERAVPYFTDYTVMLDTVKPDGVIIATPNIWHSVVGLACVERGIPALVEKPIADTVETAQALTAAAERAGVSLLVGHHRRYNPIIETSRAIVQGGQLGRLVAVNGMWLLQKPNDYFEVAHRREPGGGPILINLIHDIDDLRYICGEITGVQAFTSNVVRGLAVEDSAAIALRFANGALGTMIVSDTVAAPWSWEITAGEAAHYPQRPENCYLFAGTAGSLAVPRLDLWRYTGDTGWYAPLSCERIPVTHADPQPLQLRHFCRVIRGEEEPRVSAADATRTLIATLAVHRAAATGGAITID